MNDFNLITAAVAAASAFGFLAALGLMILLLLVCAGLYHKARRLQGEFNRANDLKQEFQNKYLVVCREKASLAFEVANLRGQVSDPLLQRRVTGAMIPMLGLNKISGLAPVQFTVSIGDTRPAPYGLMARAFGTRAEFSWCRNATDNTGVEYCLNDGPWRPLIDDTTSLSFILPKATTYYIRVRNTWHTGIPHSPSSSCTISMPKAA